MNESHGNPGPGTAPVNGAGKAAGKVAVKVAILGGGAGGLSAAWALTEGPWRDRYQVTVYQMGWRLGGKGASGRNHLKGERVEEHGLHMWFGFYENAFRMMKDCYQQWRALRPDCPVKDCFGQAFIPHSHYVLNEHRPDGWHQWPLDLPESAREPGDGQRVRFSDSLAFAKIGSLIRAATRLEQAETVPLPEAPLSTDDPQERVLLAKIRQRYLAAAPALEGTGAAPPVPASVLLTAARDLLVDDQAGRELLPIDHEDTLQTGLGQRFRRSRFRAAVAGAAVCMRWAREALQAGQRAAPANDRLRRLYLAVDCAAAILCGLHRDIFVARKRFKELDELDLNDWLVSHGADPQLVLVNPIVRFAYSVVFAFEDGDSARPRLAAGAALQGLLRLFLSYKGALAYRLATGMGDVVFSPLY